MNAIESALLEQMEQEKFQRVVADNFSFVDSLIDETTKEEDE